MKLMKVKGIDEKTVTLIESRNLSMDFTTTESSINIDWGPTEDDNLVGNKLTV